MTASLKILTKGSNQSLNPNAVEMPFETELFEIPGKGDLESDKTSECQFGVVSLLRKPIKRFKKHKMDRYRRRFSEQQAAKVRDFTKIWVCEFQQIYDRYLCFR